MVLEQNLNARNILDEMIDRGSASLPIGQATDQAIAPAFFTKQFCHL